MAKGKSANPADAFRKAQRKKELKKNKDARSKARDFALVKKDTFDLQDEIERLSGLAEPSPADQARLKEAQAELEKINKKKEEYVAEHPEQRKLVYRSRRPDGESKDNKEEGSSKHVNRTRKLFDKDGLPLHPERSIYYDPVFNPLGVPPPGMPYVERPLRPDEMEQDDEAASDDDIIMPEGPPPEDDDDDIPLPEGPPPGEAQQAAIAPPAMFPNGMPPLPPGPPPSEPPAFVPQGFPPPPPPVGFPAPPPAYPTPPPGFSTTMPPPPPAGFPGGFPPPPLGMPMGVLPPPPGVPPPPAGFPGSMPPFPPPPGFQSGAVPPPGFGAAAPPGFFPRNGPSPHQMREHRPGPPPGRTLPPPPPTLPKNPNAKPVQAVISAEPELRDFKKESTAFVPAAIRKKKASAVAKGGAVNAAPGVEAVEGGEVLQAKGPDLMSSLRGQLGGMEPKQVQKEKGDYEKFVESMGDILGS
ncbi:unnamed protein product [Peniophora sp. CBMAI 1063]|nr:unnamed protein product [Peniophora sp. CBMAI 1063]